MAAAALPAAALGVKEVLSIGSAILSGVSFANKARQVGLLITKNMFH